ncbi:hypothetical protein [Candidatus Halobonum tyrrellensis]|uniref:Uncharacterized protein n=1 Tax=Candidatus Halobonum tyrrellensis G22 TaxID=1324957 RepID=V4HMF8_9EURY|nr:hypothetical protein [Candidatus Halobonum tyrrellensis]ESP89114.1 hypothetical protein K933_05408 [Candidatus Halobonum tyrrellensis G22]
MHRRGLLARLARLLAAGGLAVGAGCSDVRTPSGPRTPPRSVEPPADGDLVVADFSEREADDGTVGVRVVVENRTGEERSGTVVAEVEAGDAETTVREEVTVDSSDRVEVTLPTDLAYEEFARNGSIAVRIE